MRVRILRPNLRAIQTATRLIVAGEGQAWYETPKAFELWETDPLRRIKRWPRVVVFWELEKMKGE